VLLFVEIKNRWEILLTGKRVKKGKCERENSLFLVGENRKKNREKRKDCSGDGISLRKPTAIKKFIGGGGKNLLFSNLKTSRPSAHQKTGNTFEIRSLAIRCQKF